MTNILLIDDTVLDSKIFIDSCNENTIPFVYSQNTTRENVLEFLEQNVRNSQIQRLGFVFEINPHYIFLNEEPLFESGIISTNTQFLINIIQQYKIEHIDFLACETLLESEWNDFYKLLMENTTVIVGASNNKTGNLLFGGDWIMESTSTDIELIYFNKSIEYYKYLLGFYPYTAFVRNGIVYACGDNYNAQLGDGTTKNRSILNKIQIPAGNISESVNCGTIHTIVKMTNGTMWSCGYNGYGQLGINSTQQQNTLVQMIIPSGKIPQSVNCGFHHTIVKMTNGTIYGCGYNGYGQLGNNSTTNSNILVQMQIPGGNTPESVNCGYYITIVKMTNGTIWGCGYNGYGQLGNNSTTSSTILVQMQIPVGNVPESVNCGSTHTIVKMTNGTMWCCGLNDYGQLGNNSTTNTTTLVQMINTTGKIPESANCGNSHTIVKMTDGTIWGCGSNGSGQLGNKTTVNSNTLVKMTDVSGNTPESVNCGSNHTIVKMTNGTMWGCGANSSGQLGNQTTVNSNTLVQMEFLLVYYNEGVSVQTLINQGYTVSQLNNGGITVSQLISAGITVSQLFNGGITILQLYNEGFTASQLYAEGIAVDNLLCYNIFNPVNNTLVYDVNASSTTLFTNSYLPQNIDVSAKNFKYYHLTTGTYVKYNSISISGTGVLGFIPNIYDDSIGGSNQLPINTLRFFSFYLGSSTVKYYYDNSNNLFISYIGSSYFNSAEKFDIVIKITQIGVISVYYKSIDANSFSYSNPIIGWVGNNSAVTNDDTFYKTFDGVQTFNRTTINGKFLIFDMTGLSNVMIKYNDDFVFNNNTKYTLSDITTIRNTLKTTMANTNVYNNLTSTQLTNSDLINLGFSPTPTITKFSIPQKTVLDASFTLIDPSSNSNGSFSYASSNPSVATISGKTVTIVGVVGTATITITQEATSSYESITIDESFQVIAVTTTIQGIIYTLSRNLTASVIGYVLADMSTNVIIPTSITYNDLSYNVTSIGYQAFYNSSKLASIIIPNSVTSIGNDAFRACSKLESIIIPNSVTSIGTIVFAFCSALKSVILPDRLTSIGYAVFYSCTSLSSITIPNSVTSISDLAFRFCSGLISVTFQGQNNLLSTQGSNIFLDTGKITSVTFNNTVSVNVLSPGASALKTQIDANNKTNNISNVNYLYSPTITNFSVPTKTVVDASFQITDPSSNSAGSFSYNSSNTLVATISGNIVTIVGAGTTKITATQAATSTYVSGTIDASFVVVKLTPTITNFSVQQKTVEDASFTLIAPSSNSTGLFSYTSSNTSVATISGSTGTIVGGGTSTITATQGETSNYTSGSITAEFVVIKKTPTITKFSVPNNKIYGDASFTLIDPSSNSNGSFNYTSSDTSVAIISGKTVTIVSAGTTTITATQSATNSYNSITITAEFEVIQANPTITFSIPTKTYGNLPFQITPSSNSNGSFSYTSSNTSVALVYSPNNIIIVGAGTTTIRLTQEATTNYTSKTLDTTFQVLKAIPTITNFSIPTKTAVDGSFQIIDPSTNSNGLFNYTSTDTSVATISGSTVTIVGAGITTITATQGETTNYTSKTIHVTFEVIRVNPIITNFSVPTKTYSHFPFQIIDPSTNSNGLFNYTSSDTSVATISGTTVTIVGVGITTITATQGETSIYASRTITTEFEVIQANPTITNFTFAQQLNGTLPFKITPSSNSNGSFSYTSSNPSVATISGDIIRIVDAGTATITATQAETDNFFGASIETNLLVTNPVIINDSSGLLDFMNLEDMYGVIQTNMIIDSELINSATSKKIMVIEDINVKITCA